MLKNKEYCLVRWSSVSGSTVCLDPKPLNIDTCINQFVDGQISQKMQYVSKQPYLNYNLPKFAKSGQLGPKDPVNVPIQTD